MAANSRRRKQGLADQLRRSARLNATATCPGHVEEILATSFRLQDESRRYNIEIRTGGLQVGKGAQTVCQMLRETEDPEQQQQTEDPEILPNGSWETIDIETRTG